MWTAWLLLTLNGLFFTLRLSGTGGSFPRPLKREEEQEYLKRMAEGENEILMYFRAQRKLAGELSLSDSLDAEGDGTSLSLMDVIRIDDTMLEDLDMRDACLKIRRCVEQCLSERETMIIRLRYGLGGQQPLTQREIASLCGISRSYVSQRRYCKRFCL